MMYPHKEKKNNQTFSGCTSDFCMCEDTFPTSNSIANNNRNESTSNKLKENDNNTK